MRVFREKNDEFPRMQRHIARRLIVEKNNIGRFVEFAPGQNTPFARTPSEPLFAPNPERDLYVDVSIVRFERSFLLRPEQPFADYDIQIVSVDGVFPGSQRIHSGDGIIESFFEPGMQGVVPPRS